MLCSALFILFVISLLVTSFSAFQLSPSMSRWIDRFMNSTESGIEELAALSERDALRTFGIFLGGTAAFLFLLSYLGAALFAVELKNGLIVSAVALGYTSMSINAWSKNREAILGKFKQEAIADVRRYIKYFLAFSALLVTLVSVISVAVGQFVYASLEPLIFFVLTGIFAIVVAIFLSSSISLTMVFGPAVMALVYLWLCIFSARAALIVGKARLKNFLVTYCIFATAYATVLSFPAIRNNLGLPVLCQ